VRELCKTINVAAVDIKGENMFQKMLRTRNQTIIDFAYQFFYKKLNITKEQQDLIKVECVRRLPEAADGNCKGIYCPFTGKLKQIQIKIVNYSSVFGILEVLAHELIHAKQHLNNEFQVKQIQVPFLYFWTTIRYVRVHANQILNDTPYYDMICEQEAFNTSYSLMLDFILELNNTTSTESKQYRENCEK